MVLSAISYQVNRIFEIGKKLHVDSQSGSLRPLQKGQEIRIIQILYHRHISSQVL